MKKYSVVIILSLLIAGAVIYGYYRSENNKTITKEESEKDKEVSKKLNRNLDTNYPATPREVVDYYSSLLKYMYSRNSTTEMVEEAGKKCRQLFDEELLENNPEDEYFKNLESEIKQYKEEKKIISTYILEKNGDVEYKTFDSHYYSFVDCAYYVQGEKSTSRTLETYTLRKDDEGKWKILYWKLTPVEENE